MMVNVKPEWPKDGHPTLIKICPYRFVLSFTYLLVPMDIVTPVYRVDSVSGMRALNLPNTKTISN